MTFDYNNIADEIIQMIFDYCEDNLIEADILNEILYIDIPQGQYVINKHNLTQQIWVSSPVSSAFKFSFNEQTNTWKSNEKELYSFIINELSNLK